MLFTVLYLLFLCFSFLIFIFPHRMSIYRIICIENISQYLICVYLVANYFSKEKKVFTYIQVFRFSERCTLC